jgi:hypothetical protein
LDCAWIFTVAGQRGTAGAGRGRRRSKGERWCVVVVSGVVAVRNK